MSMQECVAKRNCKFLSLQIMLNLITYYAMSVKTLPHMN